MVSSLNNAVQQLSVFSNNQVNNTQNQQQRTQVNEQQDRLKNNEVVNNAEVNEPTVINNANELTPDDIQSAIDSGLLTRSDVRGNSLDISV
ncbi:MAG: hypothetical protein AAF988_08085 [Pseudomonadota bacterium]